MNEPLTSIGLCQSTSLYDRITFALYITLKIRLFFMQRCPRSPLNMSGAEAAAVLGVISSIMTIVETIQKIYDAVKDGSGLHSSFRKIAESIPMILRSLRDVHKIQAKAAQEAKQTQDPERIREIAETNDSVYPILLACQKTTRDLQVLFDNCLPAAGASRISRFSKAVHNIASRRQNRAKSMFGDVLRGMRLLANHQVFENALNIADINATMRNFCANAFAQESETTMIPRPTLASVSQNTSQKHSEPISKEDPSESGHRLPTTNGQTVAYNNSKSKIANQGAVVFHGGQALSYQD